VIGDLVNWVVGAILGGRIFGLFGHSGITGSTSIAKEEETGMLAD
jgi:hypothetical protein